MRFYTVSSCDAVFESKIYPEVPQMLMESGINMFRASGHRIFGVAFTLNGPEQLASMVMA